jgi:hypothetical protein
VLCFHRKLFQPRCAPRRLARMLLTNGSAQVERPEFSAARHPAEQHRSTRLEAPATQGALHRRCERSDLPLSGGGGHMWMRCSILSASASRAGMTDSIIAAGPPPGATLTRKTVPWAGRWSSGVASALSNFPLTSFRSAVSACDRARQVRFPKKCRRAKGWRAHREFVPGTLKRFIDETRCSQHQTFRFAG